MSQAATVDADAAGYVEAAGHFRIYLGSAPGVGKTYAMLSEGQRRRGRGADVVAGLVESYGRPLTEGLIHGLEVIPRKTADYRGTCLEEMDLDAVLRRHPEVALVDELAHTNVPGSGPHGKRWQDVLDILKAGIDVIATVNIQHLESVADEVEHMTGAKVGERVPDWVVRKADQIELIDSSPEQLRRRMLHGNIYPKDKVPQALTHSFRTDNLIALRELALRFVADESDEELLEHLRQHQSPALWETTERIVVAVTAEPGTDVLLRRAARIAFRFKAELDVVHVIVGDTAQPRDGRPIDALRALAADLGARWHEIEDDDPARALVSFARGRQATQIMLGSHQRGWWHVADGGPIARRVIHEAGAIGIHVHLIARSELPPTEASEPNAVKEISLPSLAAVRRDGAGGGDRWPSERHPARWPPGGQLQDGSRPSPGRAEMARSGRRDQRECRRRDSGGGPRSRGRRSASFPCHGRSSLARRSRSRVRPRRRVPPWPGRRRGSQPTGTTGTSRYLASSASAVVSGVHHWATCGSRSQRSTSGRSRSVIGRSVGTKSRHASSPAVISGHQRTMRRASSGGQPRRTSLAI